MTDIQGTQGRKQAALVEMMIEVDSIINQLNGQRFNSAAGLI